MNPKYLIFGISIFLVFVGCSEFVAQQPDRVSKIDNGGFSGGFTGGTTGGSGSTTGEQPPTPPPPPPPTGGTTGPNDQGTVQTVPDESPLVQSISNSNPGLINDCVGRPIVNSFMITVMRALQGISNRWGYMKKPDGRIPRDILAFAWSTEREGTHNFYVIDFVMSGCNNAFDSNFQNPANSAYVGWIITNPNGVADNGVWSASP